MTTNTKSWTSLLLSVTTLFPHTTLFGQAPRGLNRLRSQLPWQLYLLMLLLFLPLISCSDEPTRSPVDGVKDYGFSLNHVPYSQLYKNRENLYNSYTATPQDSNGVYLFPYGGSFYYHPVGLSYRSLEALSDYNNTGDAKYLIHAEKSMEALRREAFRYKKMLYFPYKFDFAEGSAVTYVAPWFSGMAQGTALSAYSRLYHYTQNPLYKAVADSILATFTDFEGPYSGVLISPEDTLLKQAGYYWVDEYPDSQRRYVLNGSIIGAMGLYDHWWVFGDSHSAKLFSCEMTTVKDNVLLYRNGGQMSSYCLLYRNKYTTYHLVHMQILDLCTILTGDEFFAAISDLFYADHPL